MGKSPRKPANPKFGTSRYRRRYPAPPFYDAIISTRGNPYIGEPSRRSGRKNAWRSGNIRSGTTARVEENDKQAYPASGTEPEFHILPLGPRAFDTVAVWHRGAEGATTASPGHLPPFTPKTPSPRTSSTPGPGSAMPLHPLHRRSQHPQMPRRCPAFPNSWNTPSMPSFRTTKSNGQRSPRRGER